MAMAGVELSKSDLSTLQQRRETRVAIHLSDLVRKFVEGDVEGFERDTTALAVDLSKASFGTTMLHSIGFMYINSAEQWLGDPMNGAGNVVVSMFEGVGAKFRQKRQQVTAQAGALGAAWKVYQEFRKAGDDLGDGTGNNPSTPEEAQAQVKARMAAAQEAILPHVIEALWNASVLDIQTTIRHAVSKLLHDSSVTHEARVKRAYGVKAIGNVFRGVVLTEGVNARSAIEAAMRAAIFKTQGQQEEGADGEHSDGEHGAPHPSYAPQP